MALAQLVDSLSHNTVESECQTVIVRNLQKRYYSLLSSGDIISPTLVVFSSALCYGPSDIRRCLKRYPRQDEKCMRKEMVFFSFRQMNVINFTFQRLGFDGPIRTDIFGILST